MERIQAASICADRSLQKMLFVPSAPTLKPGRLNKIVDELEAERKKVKLGIVGNEKKFQAKILEFEERVQAEQVKLDSKVDNELLSKFPELDQQFGSKIKILRDSIPLLKKKKSDNKSAISDTLLQLEHFSSMYASHLESKLLAAYNRLEDREEIPELPGWNEHRCVEKHCQKLVNAFKARTYIREKLESKIKSSEKLGDKLQNCRDQVCSYEKFLKNVVQLYFVFIFLMFAIVL